MTLNPALSEKVLPTGVRYNFSFTMSGVAALLHRSLHDCRIPRKIFRQAVLVKVFGIGFPVAMRLTQGFLK